MNGSTYSSLHDAFKKLISEYASIYEVVTAKNDWQNPFRDIIAKEIPRLLRESADVREPYTVVGGYGKGRWTKVPWIAVFDTRITKSAQKGIYIVYLLNKDTKELYLTFEIAAIEAMGTKTNSEGNVVFVGVVRNNSPELKEKLRERAEQIRGIIQDTYFCSDEKINSGSAPYDSGTVYYKRYSLVDLPTGDILVQDLKQMLSIYKKYYDWANTGMVDPEIKQGEGDIEVPISTKDMIKHIREYIAAKGFTYNDNLIENFFLSLKSKPFVILAGTSGTGKTRLVKLFAEAIDAEYKLVSVRPDWSDGSDLFGHYDLNGKFIDGPVCECFRLAYENPDKPVFLCLDEMNLARVEYYLSDFLSVVESREKTTDGKVVTSRIAQYEKGIPDNLYIVGTVNMDETTFPFSKKVLDRANTIEFNYVDLMPYFNLVDAAPEKLQLPNSYLRTEYLVLSRDCASDPDYVGEICAELQAINDILVRANAHIGYRVRDEIVFYMMNNKTEGNLLSHDEAFDNEIMQKILPRIQGSSVSVRDMLCDLFKICASDPNQKSGDTDSEKMRKILSDNTIFCRYRKSAEKLELMVRRFEEDGFTSYWL